MRTISIQQKMYISGVSIAPLIINVFITNCLLLFYGKLGMDVMYYGIAILIFGVWNAINNPIIGVCVDNWNPRPGKEKLKSVMKIGAPIMFLGFLIIIFAPYGSNDIILFIFLLIGLIIFEFGRSIIEVASLTFSLMIVTEPEQRSNLIMIMKILEFIPMAFIGMVPGMFLGPENSYLEGFLILIIIISVMCIFSYLIIFKIEEPDDLFQNKELLKNEESRRVDENDSKVSERLKQVVDSIKLSFQSKSFRIILYFRVTATFFQAVYVANITLMLFWVVQIPGGLERTIFLAIGGIVFNIFYIIQNKLVKKWGVIRTIYLSFLISFIGYFFLFFSNDVVTLSIFYSLSNMGAAAIYLFTNIMIGDVGDYHFVKTGETRYSELTANLSVFNSFAPSVVIFIGAVILSITGFDGSSKTVQIPSAIMGIKIVACILPIIGLILCTLVLRKYPLQGEKYVNMRRKFNEMQNDISSNIKA